VGRPKVKVCGITRREDALDAAEAGADYLGVVLVSGTPRARLPVDVPKMFDGIQVPRVIVVAGMSVSAVARAAEVAHASVVQLHGDEGPGEVAALRGLGPWRIWKALRVRGRDELLSGLAGFGDLVDGVLLDAWHPTRLGGTGRVLSWEGLQGVRETLREGVELIVAGGLRPDNVQGAIETLRPHVVDVSSGVEKAVGIKDPRLVARFLARVRSEERGSQG